MLENFLWAIYTPDIRKCFPNRFLEGRGKGAGWSFVIFMRMGDGGGAWRRESEEEGMKEELWMK